MNNEVIQDQSITQPRKHTLIVLLVITGLIACWFITNIVTKDALYHQ